MKVGFPTYTKVLYDKELKLFWVMVWEGKRPEYAVDAITRAVKRWRTVRAPWRFPVSGGDEFTIQELAEHHRMPCLRACLEAEGVFIYDIATQPADDDWTFATVFK